MIAAAVVSAPADVGGATMNDAIATRSASPDGTARSRSDTRIPHGSGRDDDCVVERQRTASDQMRSGVRSAGSRRRRGGPWRPREVVVDCGLNTALIGATNAAGASAVARSSANIGATVACARVHSAVSPIGQAESSAQHASAGSGTQHDAASNGTTTASARRRHLRRRMTQSLAQLPRAAHLPSARQNPMATENPALSSQTQSRLAFQRSRA